MPVTITSWLNDATGQLKQADIPSARLDAEILLAHTLKRARTYLHAHPDDILEPRQLEIANARLDLRRDRIPIAYIVGHKEFYGRSFHVSPSVLIPRPESETAIELLSELIPSTLSLLPDTKRLVDVGTGSGVLGITAKLEHPELDVHLVDISRHALKIAEKNCAEYGADCTLTESDLLSNFAFNVDYIIANLPYVDKAWEDTSPELRHEPASALYADQDGLALIFKLLPQAAQHLRPGGYLLIEADPTQHGAIRSSARAHALDFIMRREYYIVFQRTTAL